MKHLTKIQKEELKDSLSKIKERIEEEIRVMKQDHKIAVDQGNHGDFTDHTAHCMDNEKFTVDLKRKSDQLIEVKDAIARYNQSTYGIIFKTQECIPYTILKANPLATEIPQRFREIYSETSFKIGQYTE